MWVQPNVYLAAHFLLSPLGLQHTLLFKKETKEQQQPWCVFLEQKTEAAWLDLYSRFG